MPRQRSDKRRADDIDACARRIIAAILALPDTWTCADVVAIWQADPATPQDKGDAFWLLDEKPGTFYVQGRRYYEWHGRLRATRNQPTHGRAMFATFNPRIK